MVATYALHYPEDYDGTARMDDHVLKIKEGGDVGGGGPPCNLR